MPNENYRTYTELLPQIRAFKALHGYGPTLREVAGFMGTKSVSLADYALHRLEEDGRIRRIMVDGRYLPRIIEIIGARGEQ